MNDMHAGNVVENGHEALWSEYWENPASGEVIGHLMEMYRPLVHAVLRRIMIRLPSHIEREDLLQTALIGLYGAIERYDPEQNVRFETFASSRIRGAILDQLRQSDFLSRGMRQRVKQIEQLMETMANEQGESPSLAELADALNTSERVIESTLDKARPWISLDQSMVMRGDQQRVPLREVIRDEKAVDPSDEAGQSDLRALLRMAFRELGAREQKILYLYYYEELRLREIAVLFDISEARVCQIHTFAVMKLKRIIEQYEEQELRVAS